MAREPWSRPARGMAREMALAGLDRDRIRDELTAWVQADRIRARMVVATWADKLAADVMSDVIGRATQFRPRVSTAGGRTPMPAASLTPSEVLADSQRYLAQTSGVAERRPYIYELANALQQGLGLWPELDEPGGSADILARLGWDTDHIALVLGDASEAA